MLTVSLRQTGGWRQTRSMLTKAEIQRLRSLREKKHREDLGLFVIEGEKVVKAVGAG